MGAIRLVRPSPRLDLGGCVVAAVLWWLSFTPSLLPRGWLMQGVVGGVCAASGYAPGCLTRPVTRRWRAGRRAWSALGVLVVPGTVLAAYHGWLWQRDLSAMAGVAAPSAVTWPGALPVAVAVFAGLLGAARLLRRARGRAVVAVIALFTAVPLSSALGVLSATLDERVTDVPAPVEGTRSGGPASLVPWASLGRQGRAFVTGAPPAGHTRAPIRVYVGLRTASTSEQRARLAVAELRRTGAFSRTVLCLVVPTGSGWIDEPTVAALENVFAGDTAVAAIQYAALPSWLSLAAEPESAEQAAADLIDEVHRAWSALPAADRPTLLLYGHSLGARAAQAPFGSADRLLGTVDGALISGLPGGDRLRPVTSPAYPRLLFLQHADDPVVWWSPGTLLHPPDRFPRRWWPVVTFWQVSADLLRAQDVPAGHGHRYGAEAEAAWRLVTAGPHRRATAGPEVTPRQTPATGPAWFAAE
ncbi:alpha/beta-hydrolase family protein [Actinoplanes philippinensis]|uniref:alpha/beta-hydrolase family protein n=1 Tax=Actinoplanes philippinensis TaxID=35752 RepID=UPI0033DB1DC0